MSAPLVIPTYTGTPRFTLAATGQTVLLRGVNVIQSAGTTTRQTRVKDIGANMARMALNWSDLEPVAPTGTGTSFSGYIHTLGSSAIAQIDSDCQFYASNGIYFQIDVHQAQWSPYFGGTGAPSWYYDKSDARFTSQQNGGVGWDNGSNPGPTSQQSAAINAFWTDPTEKAMSQALFIGLWTALIQHLLAQTYSPYMVGYHVFNEPNPGNATGSTASKVANMHAWLAPVVDAIHALDPARAKFIMALGGGQGFGTPTFSAFGDLKAKKCVLEFHSYYVGLSPAKDASLTGEVGYAKQGAAGFDAADNNDGYYPDTNTWHTTTAGTSYHGTEALQEVSIGVPLAKAAALGIPAFCGEFNARFDDPGRLTYCTHIQQALDHAGIGATVWKLGLEPTDNLALLNSGGTFNAGGLSYQAWFNSTAFVGPLPTSAITDTFTRTVSSGLGSTDTGVPWVIDQGSVSQFNVTGTECQITSVAGTAPIAHIATDLTDCYCKLRFKMDAVPLGAQENLYVALRLADPTNYWRAGALVLPGGSMTAQIQRQVANVNTQIGSNFTGMSFTAGQWYWLYFSISGVTCQLFVWPDGTAMPSTPTVQGTDVSPSISGATTHGAPGFRTQTVAGNTNSPLLHIDDLTADTLGTPPPTTTGALGVNVHFEYRVDGGLWSSTSQQSAAVTGLAPGPHTFEVRAFDGIAYTQITAYSWDITDTEVSIDTGPWTPQLSPLTFRALTFGQHIFRVRGVYSDGTRSPVSSYSWQITRPETSAPGRREVGGSPLVRWNLVLFGPTGGLIGPIREFQNAKLTIAHSGIDGLTFDVFLDDPICSRISEQSTAVKLWRSMDGWSSIAGFPDFAGKVAGVTETGSSRTATIQCWSPFYNLQARLVLQLLRYGYPLKTATPVDQGEILWALLSYTNARHTTLIERGTISPTVGRRMKYDHGTQIWQAIQDMTTVLGGLDIWPTYVHRDNDPTLARFNAAYVHGSYNPNARADYFGGTQNCLDMQRTSTSEIGSIATFVEEDGQGTQNSALVPAAFQRDDGQINSGIGLWEEVVSQDAASDTVLLQAYADEEIKQKARVPIQVQPTISPVLPPWYGRHFTIGDVIPVTSNRGRMRFQTSLRVFQAEMDLAPTGEETTTLTLAEDLAGVVQGVPA